MAIAILALKTQYGNSTLYSIYQDFLRHLLIDKSSFVLFLMNPFSINPSIFRLEGILLLK